MTAASGQAAIDRANGYTSYSSGMCLQWVRGPCWDIASYFGSAIEAWNGAKHKHPNDRNPPDGAPLFYRGGQYGHIVIHRSDDMRSTDCTSRGRVSAADIDWPVRNWGFTYLGWTDDLNGVMLPLGGAAPPEDDDMPNYDHASFNGEKNLPAGEWVKVAYTNVPAGDAFAEGKSRADIPGARFTATFTATVTAPEGSAIRLRTIEVAEGAADEIAEANAQTEHTATGGASHVQHQWTGQVAKDRRLHFQIKCVAGGTLTDADASILSW